MYPELIKIGDFSISSFGVMVALGFLTSYWLALLEFRRKGFDEKILGNFFIAAMVGGVIGAKLLFIFENVPLSDFLNNPFTYLFSRGGLTFYGGFIVGFILTWIVVHRSNLSYWQVGDACAPGMALGYAVGRIGCFLVGDDYGIPSSLPWAISFPNGLPPTIDRVHPTQLYEVIFMTVVFLILWKIRKLDKPNGWMFTIYLIFAASERFLIEFVRSTTPSHILSLSLAQVTAIIIIAIGVGKLVLIQKSEQNLANQNK